MGLREKHLQYIEDLLCDAITDAKIEPERDTHDVAVDITRQAIDHLFWSRKRVENEYTALAYSLVFATCDPSYSAWEVDNYVKAAFLLYALGEVREKKFKRVDKYEKIHEKILLDPALNGVENWSHTLVDALAIYCESKGRFDLAARAMRKIKDERAKAYAAISLLQKMVIEKQVPS